MNPVRWPTKWSIMGEWLWHNRIKSMGGYITEKREVWWIDVQVSILIEDLYNFPCILGCTSLRPPIADCWHSLFVRTNTVFSSTINFWVSWLTILAYDETLKDRCVAEAPRNTLDTTLTWTSHILLSNSCIWSSTLFSLHNPLGCSSSS